MVARTTVLALPSGQAQGGAWVPKAINFRKRILEISRVTSNGLSEKGVSELSTTVL